jgi:hypothetical protein
MVPTIVEQFEQPPQWATQLHLTRHFCTLAAHQPWQVLLVASVPPTICAVGREAVSRSCQSVQVSTLSSARSHAHTCTLAVSAHTMLWAVGQYQVGSQAIYLF